MLEAVFKAELRGIDEILALIPSLLPIPVGSFLALDTT
jgi:hypothetical protein